ncbi:MAG: tRNA guanosine(15) transglycosylase TgtA [Thermoproteota archaeon]
MKNKDLLGRIGYLTTPRMRIETPTLLPVINPIKLVLTPRELYDKYGIRALMTNAYLVRKYFGQEAIEKGIHRLLDFEGLIVTDSGAYQALKYGGIDVEQKEILDFQEAIHPDVGVILDVPTGSELDKVQAKFTVEETIRRADEALSLREKKDIVWIGPIQGGTHLDLLSFSAREMSKRPYSILALGSPTVVMERYRYSALVDMIMTTKMNIPPSRPLHLFGAGHPSMLSFAVALGCDLFDSAAYALFAYEDRYMTENGTLKLEDIDYLPCLCPTCSKTSASELKSLEPNERARSLASHNLWATLLEIKKIKQAIHEGRLWELLERRSRTHPALLEALQTFKKYILYFEKHSPSNKPHGIFYYGSESLARPEITRFRMNLDRYLSGFAKSDVILLVVHPWGQPSVKFIRCAKKIAKMDFGLDLKKALLMVFVPPFGAVPIDLLDVYPVGKITMSSNLDEETLKETIKFSSKILGKNKVITISDSSLQAKKILSIRTWLGESVSINLFKGNLGKETRTNVRKKKRERKEKS